MRICRLGSRGKEIVEEIREGAIFIYPTDTIYGIGCSALKKKSVQKIRRMKKSRKDFSVIAPSKKWILENLKVRHKSHLKRLPGKYTLIFEKKRKKFLFDCSKTGKLGARIPKNNFTKLVRSAGVPFVTTSVNVSGKKHIRRISQIPKSFLKNVDFVIDSGVLGGRPSRILDLTGKTPAEIKRKK